MKSKFALYVSRRGWLRPYWVMWQAAWHKVPRHEPGRQAGTDQFCRVLQVCFHRKIIACSIISTSRSPSYLRIYSYWVSSCNKVSELQFWLYRLISSPPYVNRHWGSHCYVTAQFKERIRPSDVQWSLVSGSRLFAYVPQVSTCQHIMCSSRYSGLEYFISQRVCFFFIVLLSSSSSCSAVTWFLENAGHQSARLHLWAPLCGQPLLVK